MSSKKDESIGWMYDGVKSNVNREDYLLGKKVDKNFEKYSDVVNEQKPEALDMIVKTRTIASSSAGHKTSSLQKDIIRSEDPFVAVKVREETKRRELMDNPLMKMRLQKMLKTMMSSKTKEKKHKKKSKKVRKRSRSSSEDSNEGRRSKRKISSSPKRKRSGEKEEENGSERRRRRDSSSETRRKVSRRRDEYEGGRSKSKRQESPERRRSRRDSSPVRRSRSRSDSRVERRRRRRDSSRSESGKKNSESRKKKDSNNSRSRSNSWDEDPKPSTSRRDEKNYDSHIPEHLRNNKMNDRSSEDEDDSRRNEEDDVNSVKKSYGLVEMRKKNEREEVEQPTKELKLIKFPTGRGDNLGKERKPRKVLTEEEKAERLAEMQENAKWRNEVRLKNLEKVKIDAEEEKQELDNHGYAPSFIRNQMRNACDDMTVEKRLQSNKGGVQRSHGYMDKSFARK